MKATVSSSMETAKNIPIQCEIENNTNSELLHYTESSVNSHTKPLDS